MDFQGLNLAFQSTRLHEALELGSIGESISYFEFHDGSGTVYVFRGPPMVRQIEVVMMIRWGDVTSSYP